MSNLIPKTAGVSLTKMERFWSKVEKQPGEDGCWIWTAHCNKRGYGKFGVGARIVWLAHRWAYTDANGPIPEGLELDHRCRTPACVRPDHLEPVTHRENMRRGSRAQQTHCIHGHEFTAENTIRKANGTRACRACVYADNRRRYHRGRALVSRS